MISTTIRSACLGWLCLTAALVAGCGGVDSGGTGSYSSGPIEGFGSVIVNGVRYDGGTVEDDEGEPIDRDDLRLGMRAEIEASEVGIDASGASVATARTIRIASDIVGRVDAVDAASGRLVVFGQTVQAGDSTSFDERFTGGIAGVRTGDLVEVHGDFNAALGVYSATRVGSRVLAPIFRLRGFVSQLDTAAMTFRVGGQPISYANPAVLPQGFENGRFVRVLVRDMQVGGQWEAVSVRPGARALGERLNVRMLGRIVALDAPDRFSVNGVPVDARSALFADGPIALGLRVSLQGAVSAGELVASRVEIVTDLELLERGYTLTGTITQISQLVRSFELRGVTVLYPALVTRFEGGNDDDLDAGRRVHVRGLLSLDRTRLVATVIRFLP